MIVDAKFDKGTVFRWENEGFEFWPATKRRITDEEREAWDEKLRANGMPPMQVYYDASEQAHVCRIEGPLASLLYNRALNDNEVREVTGGANTAHAVFHGDRGSLADSARALRATLYAAERPRWEGSPGLDKVWDALNWQTRKYHREDIVSGMDVTCADGRIALQRAHPVHIPPQQARVIPELDLDEAHDTILNAQLPFEPLFIDLCAASGGVRNELTYVRDDEGNAIALAGAVIYTSSRQGYKAVVPFGALMLPTEKTIRESTRHNTKRHTLLGAEGLLQEEIAERQKWGMCLADPSGQGLTSHSPLGTVLLAQAGGRHERSGGFSIRLHDKGSHEPIERLRTASRRPDQLELAWAGGELFDATDRLAFLLGLPDLYAYQLLPAQEIADALRGWTDILALQFRKVAGIVQFLQSYNVELAEPTLTRQVRRQAERKNTPIARTVYVRHRRSASNGNGSDPNAPRQVGTTHQFEVGGNVHHVQRGKHVWCKKCLGEGRLEGPILPDGSQDFRECDRCKGKGRDIELDLPTFDPDKVNDGTITPCARRDSKGNLTCPHGCRKEWVPAFVKGDPDAPLVPKTRRVI